MSTSLEKRCTMTRTMCLSLQAVNKERFRYSATEGKYLVLLTGSPTRVPHWARSMQWRRGRRRSSIVCWSSCLRQRNVANRTIVVVIVVVVVVVVVVVQSVCWYSTLADPLADSRYIALAKRGLVIHQAVMIKNARARVQPQ